MWLQFVLVWFYYLSLLFAIKDTKMDHLAIMRKSWDLTAKILSGEKTIETRWYKNKSAPWDKIKPRRYNFFQRLGLPRHNQGDRIKSRTISNLTDEKIQQLLSRYSAKDLGTTNIPGEINYYVFGKKYCVIIHLMNPTKVRPFNISKKGFGAMAAWIIVDKIQRIIV